MLMYDRNQTNNVKQSSIKNMNIKKLRNWVLDRFWKSDEGHTAIKWEVETQSQVCLL